MAMENATRDLSPLPEPAKDAPEVYYLTGRRFVYQTVLCAVSLSKQAGRTFRFVAVDDGTLTDVESLCCAAYFAGFVSLEDGS